MNTLELLSLLVAIAALFGWVSSRWLRLPITIGTMVLTVGVALCLEAVGGYAPGLHAWALRLVGLINFENLILHGMLSLLLFAGAFLLDLEWLGREKLAVGILAVAGTVISFAATAALMHWLLALLGLQTGWVPCFFFGALISPTDPIAVLEMLRRVGIPKHIEAQLAGESLFNDGVGAVIFLALLDASRGTMPSTEHIGAFLLLKAGGGIALGVVGAWLISSFMRVVDAYQVEVLMTIALGLGGYALADVWHLSAPLEAVVAGIALRWFNRNHPPHEIAHHRIDGFWEVVDEIQNSVLFVLLGLEILAIRFEWASIESGAAAIVVVTAVRFSMVTVLLWVIRRIQRGHPSSTFTLGWGGLRGGLSLALALAVPVSQGRSWIVATTYAVVLFSIVFQGGTMGLFLRRYGAPRAVPPS